MEHQTNQEKPIRFTTVEIQDGNPPGDHNRDNPLKLSSRGHQDTSDNRSFPHI